MDLHLKARFEIIHAKTPWLSFTDFVPNVKCDFRCEIMALKMSWL